MTCGDIIAKVDVLEPNQYDTTQKLDWLSILDGKIKIAVILTHEPVPPVPPHLSWPDPLSRDWRHWPQSTCEPRPIYPIPMPQPQEEEEDGEKEEPKPPYHSAEDELIVPDPYGSQIYVHWLQAMIASENAEIAKYNQQMVLYNNAYQEWADFYNRTHMPARPHGSNRYRF